MPTISPGKRNLTKPVPLAEVERLGQTSEGDWVRWPATTGDEYLLDRWAMLESDRTRPLAEGELRVAVREVFDDLGTPTERTNVGRGWKYPAGSFAKSVDRDRVAVARFTPKPARPVDIVRRLPALRGRPPMVLLANESRGALDTGRPAATGVEDIIARLAKAGVELRLTTGGRLLVLSTGGRITDPLLNVCTRLERLLVSHLSGQPLRCELHEGKAPPVATTIVAIDVPVCAPCAAGSGSVA
jgi:hypothetical protein